MLKDIQEHMHALVAQHGNALVALVTLWQQPEAQQNDSQGPDEYMHNVVYIERFWKCSL